MNNKYPILWLFICLLSACNQSTDTAEVNTAAEKTIVETSQSLTSVTLSPHLAELVYSAGGSKSLLGISAYTNFPQEVINKIIIGDAFHLNLEVISELNPDVIFYWHNGTPVQTVEQLISHGYNLVNIEIEQLSDIPKAIKQIAETLNTSPINETKQFNPELNLLKQQKRNQKTALIQISDQPIYTVNGSHWMSEAITVCGLKNVFNDLEQYSAAVTLESVVLNKPEVIVRLEALTADSQLAQWSSIPAIKNNHIAVLNADHFTRPTLRTLSAIKSLCEQVESFKSQ